MPSHTTQTKCWEVLQSQATLRYRVSMIFSFDLLMNQIGSRCWLAKLLPTNHFMANSLQAYVPYMFWSDLEPRVASLLQSSLVDYRQELLIENLSGIPLQQQHGSADDNVSVYHSRRMSQLVSQTGSYSDYKELEGQGHWFDGVMTTASLCNFYDRLLKGVAKKPSLPRNFTIHIANPANMGSRGGILTDQLIFPDQIGKIEIDRDLTLTAWTVRTSNILRFHLVPVYSNYISPVSVIIDGSDIELTSEPGRPETWFVRSSDGPWQVRHCYSHSVIKTTLT